MSLSHYCSRHLLIQLTNKEGTHDFPGFSFYMGWFVFFVYLWCGVVFLFCSKKRKHGIAVNEEDRDQVIGRWKHGRFIDFNGYNMCFIDNLLWSDTCVLFSDLVIPILSGITENLPKLQHTKKKKAVPYAQSVLDKKLDQFVFVTYLATLTPNEQWL